MKLSKLNIAVLVQLAGLLMLGLSMSAYIRLAGIAVIIYGGLLYRREQKQLKAAVAPVVPSDPTQP